MSKIQHPPLLEGDYKHQFFINQKADAEKYLFHIPEIFSHILNFINSLLIILLIIIPSVLFAKKPVIVTADSIKKQESVERNPSSGEIIDTKDDKNSKTTVSEKIKEKSGISIQNYGGIGSKSSVSVRGSTPGQVAVYYDGIPLNDPLYGEYNLNALSLDSIDSIELFRGSAPGYIPQCGIGGVLNLVPLQQKDTIIKLLTSYGSYNYFKQTYSSQQHIQSFYYDIRAIFEYSKNNFLFIDDNGTPIVNTADDRLIERKNNSYLNESVFLVTGYKKKSWGIQLLNIFSNTRQQMAGMYNNNITMASTGKIKNISALKFYKKGLASKRLNINGILSYTYKQSALNDPLYELETVYTKQTGFFHAPFIMATGEIFIPEAFQKLTVLIQNKTDIYMRTDISSTALHYGPEQLRDEIIVKATDDITLLKDTLVIQPMILYSLSIEHFAREDIAQSLSSYDYYFQYRHNYSWNLGATWFFYKKKKRYLSLKVNAGFTYRNPSFAELFGDRGFIIGNADLLSETSWNCDLGINASFKSPAKYVKDLNASATGFFRAADNLITFIHNSQWTMQAQNISSALVAGIEASVSATFFSHILLSASYTMNWTRDTGEIPYYRDNYLPHIPLHKASFKTKIFFSWFSVTYDLDYTGALFRDRINSAFYYIPWKLIHNLKVSFNYKKYIVFSLDIKNIGNELKKDVIGYPIPGRSFYGTLSFSY